LGKQIEIICVGNELLIGKILNTNAHWLAKRTTSLGMTVRRVTVVSDDIAEIATAVRESLKRKPKLIITTGGLGPTFDDKTLEGIAKALKRKLEVNEKALGMVREKYEAYVKQRKIERVELTPPRVKMAKLPERSKPLPNPVGTAPGVETKVSGTVLIALPGVPSEMEAIFEESIAPLIKREAGATVFFERSIFADGIMESALAPLIDEVMHGKSYVYIKSHPKGQEKKPHLEVHFSTTSNSHETARKCVDGAVTQLSQLIEENGGTIRRQNEKHEH
jgi:molybdenum cofactor synthesis domain-containing protein